MGIWDKLKSAKNYLTGGGVFMELFLPEVCYLRKPFFVKLYIEVENQDIDVDSIYIHILHEEKVSVPIKETKADGTKKSKRIRKSNILFEKKVLIEEDVVLEANEKYEFEIEIELPSGTYPSFIGKYSEINWGMRAVAVKSGTNPKSDMMIFEPYYEIK